MIIESEVPVHDAEEGENYFVSMTDMMIGVLFIFIIMLMSIAFNLRTQTDVQVDTLERLRRIEQEAQRIAAQLGVIETRVSQEIATLDRSAQTRREMLQRIREELRSEGIVVEIDEVNGVLRLTERAIRFAPNDSGLNADALENVQKIATVLSRVLPAYTACKGPRGSIVCDEDVRFAVNTVLLEGHTDITGTDDRNWALSTERANNTYREMVAASPELRELRSSKHEEIISVSGYSSTRPIDLQDNPEAWTRNRRIDLRFVMEVDNARGLREISVLTGEMRGEIAKLMTLTGVTP